jgi:hypothetical protein
MLSFPERLFVCELTFMEEVIFEVREDEVDGGFVAVALGHSIATEAETLEELREMVRDAVHCHFGDESVRQVGSHIRLTTEVYHLPKVLAQIHAAGGF